MALKHFWFRQRLLARDRMRRRIEKYYAQSPNLWRESLARLYRRKVATLSVLVLSIFGCGFLVFPTIAREPSGIPGGTLDMFNANDIPYWDPCAGDGGGSGSGGSFGGINGAGGDVSYDGIPAVNLSDVQAKFVDDNYAFAQKLSIEYGIPWETVVAQGINESGSGTSNYAVNRNNFFGIGAVDSNPDAAYYYDTPEDGWRGYYEFIRGNVRYRQQGVFQNDFTATNGPGAYRPALELDNNFPVRDNITNPLHYLQSIWEAYYASDPAYYDKTAKLIAAIANRAKEKGWASSSEMAQKYPEMLKNAASLATGGEPGTFTGAVTGGGGSGGGSTSMSCRAEGDDNRAKIWNWFVNANIDKVSNDPAVIAGIMGNFWDESEYDPYSIGGGDFIGLWQVGTPSGYKGEFMAAVNSKAGSYWGGGAPQSAIGKAIEAELEYLTTGNTGGTWQNFVNSLDSVTNKTPEGYATLFESCVENSGGQGMQKRFDGANEVYVAYGQNCTSTSNCVPGEPSGSTVEIDQDGWITGGIEGFEKQDVTGGDYTFAKASSADDPADNDNRLGIKYANGKPISIMLHYTAGVCEGLGCFGCGGSSKSCSTPPHFTIDVRNKKIWQHFPMSQPSFAARRGDRQAIQIEIVGVGYDGWAGADASSDWNLKNFTDENWDYLAQLLLAINDYTDVPLTSDLDWSKPNQIDNWKTYKGVMGHMHTQADLDGKSDPGDIWDKLKAAIDRVGNTSASEICSSETTDLCGNVISSGSGSTASSGSIKALQDLVLEYAWPSYTDPNFDPKPEYVAPFRETVPSWKPITDCGMFVTVLMRKSGWDPNYNPTMGLVSDQLVYLRDPANGWEELPNITDASQLQPGDVAIYPNQQHTFLYVGKIEGFASNIASASLYHRVPMADTMEGISGRYWFRKKGQ